MIELYNNRTYINFELWLFTAWFEFQYENDKSG